MRVFNARVGLMIASMNNASLKFKKDLAIKRDTSKASKKAAAGKDKTAVQAEKQSATQVVDKVDKGVRRASLVTFDDSKVVYEKTFSMWMILDKFSRAKVCERVLQKLYRSHRMAVKEYSTKILPKWEAWRAAQDIRDSVKSYITDASSRSSRSQSIISSGTMAAPDNDASSRSSRSKSFISSGTMAAPEYPRLRCQPNMTLALHIKCNHMFHQVAASCSECTAVDWSHNFRSPARSNVRFGAAATNKRQGRQALTAQKVTKMESRPGSHVGGQGPKWRLTAAPLAAAMRW